MIEVSDSSRWVDFHKKAPLYARAGIREYWIVDVLQRRLFVHRDPNDRGYTSVDTLNPAETVASLSFPDDVFAVEDLTG